MTLSAAGIVVAVDDFGVGFSSINNLRAFPIDQLKIDRSFAHAMMESKRDADLVDISGQAKAQRLNAEKVDLFFQDPARVVFAETGRLHQGKGLILRRIGADVLARFQHGSS